jgi:SAM-dependent methyltransferase
MYNIIVLQKNKLLQILLLLTIIIVFFLIYKLFRINNKNNEGFTQNEKFVLKQNGDIYDDFYVQIYPEIYLPEKKCSIELDVIIKNTMPNEEYSVFLEIGPTGCLLNKLQNKGFRVFGLDKSKEVCDYCYKEYPNLEIKNGDAMQPIIYDKGTFSHILCFGNTINEIKDKYLFFRNCYYWLKVGGYLIIELKDPNNFNKTIPCAENNLSIFNLSPKNNINEFNVDFGSFIYKAKYDLNKLQKSNQILLTENFTDVNTGNIRQNENTLYMEPIDNTLEISQFIGLSIYGKSNTDDKNSFIYILQRNT